MSQPRPGLERTAVKYWWYRLYELRWWLRGHLTPVGRRERREAKRWYELNERAKEQLRRWAAGQPACKHASRRPNPDARPRPGYTYEICNDCGVGVLHIDSLSEHFDEMVNRRTDP